MHNTFLKTFFATFLGLLAVVVAVNIVADPMQVLPFVHKLNNRIRFINERQQKTNQLFFAHYYGVKDFDGIVLGSSRSTGINTALLSPQYTVFNYAAAASQPQEVISYASFAEKLHGRPLAVIVLGLDFMSSGGEQSKSKAKGLPVVYTQEVYKPFFTLANLFNLKAFHLATRIIRANLHPSKEFYYQRKYWAVIEEFRPPEPEQKAAFDETLAIYRGIYRKYHYNPDYRQILQEIKDAFPRTRFIVFTTPVAAPHFEMLAQYNLTDAYAQWLTDITDVFGEVYHFMDLNPVTQNYKDHFTDSHHLYPQSADLMIKRVLGGDDVPDGFGKHLTPQNLPAYLDGLFPRE